MPQYANTNSLAYTRLRPLQNNNYGEVVLNHIKYMRATKDKEDALKFERDMKQAEFDRKNNVTIQKRLKEYGDAFDVQGYWKSEGLKWRDAHAQEFAENAKKALNGDNSAFLRNQELIKQGQSIANLSNSITEKIQGNLEQIAKNDYNPYTDKEKVELTNALAGGHFKLDEKTAKMRVYSADGKKILYNGLTDPLASGINNISLNKMPDFRGIGSAIAKEIPLDDIEGQKTITPTKENASIVRWKNELKKDTNALETAIGMYDVDVSNGIDDSILTSLANKLHKDFTYDVWGVKTKDEELARLEKEQKEATLANTKASTYRTYNPVVRPTTRTATERKQQQEDDYFRTTVDKIRIGDKTALNSLVQPPNKNGYISKADWDNGVLRYVISKGEEDPQEFEIDTTTKEGLGKLFKLIEPKLSTSELVGMYDRGVSDIKYTKPEKTQGIGKFKENDIRKAIIDGGNDEAKIVKNLGKVGIIVKGVGIVRDVIEYDGKEYLVNNDANKEKTINTIIRLENEKAGLNTEQSSGGNDIPFDKWKETNPKGTFKDYLNEKQ